MEALMRRGPAQRTTVENIEQIIRLEEEDEKRISPTERIAETIGSFAGTIQFILLQLVFVTAWILANTGLIGGMEAFDPYPFSLLSMLLSLEAVLLTAFVLIRQNRMSMRADHRSHLDLQINLLSEQEVTKVLQVLQRMSHHLGIKDAIDPETKELAQETEVDNVQRDLRASLKEKDPDES
jgi:uncharacterized membrane protein